MSRRTIKLGIGFALLLLALGSVGSFIDPVFGRIASMLTILVLLSMQFSIRSEGE